MFARSQRLRKNSDILRVYKRGNRAYTNHLKLHYIVNPRGTRVAVVVSKKVDKRAVIRNTAKRRVRELIREELKVLSPAQFDIIVTIQTGLVNVSVSELRSEVGQLLGRMK